MTNTNLSNNDIRLGMSAGTRGGNPSTNWASLAISIARVKEVLYEDMKCTLVVLTGESDIFEYTGVDITLAGGGRRTFFGAMPERGDMCFVGWAVRESAGAASSKSPVILGWMPSAPWMGHEWIPYQPMEPGEGMDTVRERTVASGVMERSRFKMRHLAPGNVVLSSGQGSDVVLDEGVLITNRRANEIRLRDEDQALVVRSLQQFHAMAGVRTYGGMVQREARLLPSTMWSDGVYWDYPRQSSPGHVPYTQADLRRPGPYPNGFLTPGLIFRRNPGENASEFEIARGAILPSTLDPFEFLQWGAFINNAGFRTDTSLPGGVSNTVYGGKALYRVGLTDRGVVDNAISSRLNGQDATPTDALTEYRLEVTHTADGTLPVTEQTDGLDVEKLPNRAPSDGDPMSGGAAPYLEWVLGSVVGNEPFSLTGKPVYGLPLRPVVFTEGGDVSPAMASAIGFNLRDHAATLFRLTPPVPGVAGSSFTSWTKDGRFKAFVAGGPVSAEVATSGDLSLSVGGSLNLSLTGGLHFNGAPGPGGVGLNLGSATGAVVISGGGSLDTGAGARDAAPGNLSAGNAPSLLLQGAQNVTMRSDGSVVVNAPEISLTNAGTVNVVAQNLLTLGSGSRVSLTAQSLDQIISGREITNYGGPHEFNPANGPTRQVTFSATPATGSIGGVADRYKMIFGDRLEEFVLQGNHTTRMLAVGDLTYETRLGKWTAKAGTNTMEVSATGGVTTNVAIGSHSTTVTTGGITQTAQTDVTTRAITGTVTLQGAQGVVLKAPGAASGDILCGSDLDPLTGIPYSSFLVPKLQKLGSI